MNYIREITADAKKFSSDLEFDPKATKWDYHLTKIMWHPDWPAENFFLMKGQIIFSGKTYPGIVYYPDPALKPNNIMPNTILEMIAPPLPFLEGQVCGQKVALQFPAGRIVFNGL